jgi:thiol-disulfide isomerase/thioredoxin
MRRSTMTPLALLLISLILVACGRVDTTNEASDEQAAADIQAEESTEQPTEMDESLNDRDNTEDEEEDQAAQSYAGTVPAPEFPPGLDWLNTERPLSLADLRGKAVLLDFWTYGCINCIHIIPDLKKLEEKYADELVVIGVHSAKFENEGDTDNIRRIILRYELEHPVINDNQFQVWGEYGARAWPTLVLIDPEGNVLGFHSGEGIYGPFDEVIGAMVDEFDTKGRIDRTPLNLKLEKDSQVDSPLLFPGKILVDGENDRLFIADSNHNRIVITDLEGTVLEVVGDGRARLEDGSYETASFFRPQGLTLADEDTLYVADTENHAIRRIDLATMEVETVAGTGQQVYMRFPAGPALTTPLNSPWDVLYHDGKVYIAMAGQHQLWAYEPESKSVMLHAGSGREELTDGALTDGGLNQPSGLATDGEILYFADSEASAIRTADIDTEGKLSTIVGTGLFDFGDEDGVGDDVRLQHPLGVVYQDGLLYVTDTYNSKVKVIDPETKESTTLLGGEESGWRDGDDPLFDEPGGLSIHENKIYIADTNNHVVRIADLDSEEVNTLVLIDTDGLLTRQAPDQEYSGKFITLDEQVVATGEGKIQLEVDIPDGYYVNESAPFSMDWTSSNNLIGFDPDVANTNIAEPEFPLSFSAEFSEGADELTGDLVIYYCQGESRSLCLIERVRVKVPVNVMSEGNDTVEVSHVIETPPSATSN